MEETSSGARELLRQELLAILQRQAERSRAFALPEPPPALAEYRRRLLDDRYTVLVAGEAKRGKSTLVNALIGQPLLPTAVEIATSQVFHIAHAEQAAYRLRFEDGSQQPIAADELAAFGSQTAVGAHDTPSLDRPLRWIEVELPLRFLPPNLRVLDTPGLGSLHARHAEITHRFVPHADAVLYVLDSSRPIGQLDLDFLSTILSATSHVFFIQTMIDLHRRADWQDVQRRNQQILAERFVEKLPDTRVWPISGALLLTGAQSGDDDYVQASRQAAMMEALRAFLFRVTGLDRYAQTLAVADGYHRAAGRVLAARLAALDEATREARAAIQQQATQRREQFEAEWGERGGAKRLALLDGVRRAAATGKQGFAQIFQPGGDLALAQEARIAAISSVQEANAVGERLAAEVVTGAAETWQRVCAQVQARCEDLVRPLAEEAIALEIGQSLDSAAIDVGAAPDTFKDDWWLRIRGAYANTAFLIGLGSLVPGVGALVHVAALWNVARGSWKGADNPQVKIAQQELRRHLGTVLQRVRRHFLDVDLAGGRPSLVDDYFFGLERLVAERVQAVVRQRGDAARAEVAQMVDAAKLDDRQRAERAAELRQQLAEWESLGQAIGQAAARLRRLHDLPGA